MRYPIRTQILLPFSATQVVAVMVIAVTAAWLAVRQAEHQTLGQIRNVAATLNESSLNYTEGVLAKMSGLSGAEFIALDRSGDVVVSTISVPESVVEAAARAPVISSGSSLDDFPSIQAEQAEQTGSQEEGYFAARVRAGGSARVATLLVLYPQAGWREARWTAIWPPLLIGAITVVVMAMISAWIAHRIAGRIHIVRSLLGDIAAGRFPEVPAGRTSSAPPGQGDPEDEIDELVLSARELSSQLQELQQTIRQTERVRLLAQLAGGLAHQLRNAVTGARMAVQLHQQRCPLTPSELSSEKHSGDEVSSDEHASDEHASEQHASEQHASDEHAPDDYAPDEHASDAAAGSGNSGTRDDANEHRHRIQTGSEHAGDETLQVALRQLHLTEEQIRGLLSLSRQETPPPEAAPVSELVQEVIRLLSPQCEHARVRLTTGDTLAIDDQTRSTGPSGSEAQFRNGNQSGSGNQSAIPDQTATSDQTATAIRTGTAYQTDDAQSLLVRDSEAFRTALLNLSLNAVEAAGSGGQVRIVVNQSTCPSGDNAEAEAAEAGPAEDDDAEDDDAPDDDAPDDDAPDAGSGGNQTPKRHLCVEVIDTGPGPPAELKHSLFDPFVTSKPEGVGLGLALATRAAESLHGKLSWSRQSDLTVFRLEFPVTVDDRQDGDNQLQRDRKANAPRDRDRPRNRPRDQDRARDRDLNADDQQKRTRPKDSTDSMEPATVGGNVRS